MVLICVSGKHGFGTTKNRFGITVGMCVCWDIAFPEGFRHMVFKDGAQLVIAPGKLDTIPWHMAQHEF